MRDEMSELLGLVDSPGEPVPPEFDRRLWGELAATFETSPEETETEPAGIDAGDRTVVLLPADAPDLERRRSTRWALQAAVLVAVVALGALLVTTRSDRRESASVTESLPAATTPPAEPDGATTTLSDGQTPAVRLLDPVEACERFRARMSLVDLVALPDALENSENPADVEVVRADIDRARRALEIYAADLDAGGLVEEDQLLQLTNLARSYGQAIVELDGGDPGTAGRTVDTATNQLGSLLSTGELPALRFDAFGDRTITCEA